MKQTGKVFHIGYMYRYNPCIIDALKKTRRGDLGEIISVEVQMNCFHPPQMREWLKNLPGGMMFYLGCHLIDLIFSIQGTPKRIYPFNKCSGFEIKDGEDFGFAVLEYSNGVSFAKTTAIEMGGFERRQLVINGTKGTIELKPLEWLLPQKHFQNTAKKEVYTSEWHTSTQKEWCAPFDRYIPMIQSFGEMVLGKQKNPYTLDYELELFKLILKACGE
jgi:predicted dehydrogenase